MAKRRKRSVKASALAADVRAKINDNALMEKYRLDSRQLEFLLQELVNKKVLTQTEIDARCDLAETAITQAFVETQQSIAELDDDPSPNPPESTPASQPSGHRSAGKKRSVLVQSKRRQISSRTMVADIKKGFTDLELMKKYDITPRQLEYLFKKLIDVGRLQPSDFYNRSSLTGSSITKAFVQVYDSLRELDD